MCSLCKKKKLITRVTLWNAAIEISCRCGAYARIYHPGTDAIKQMSPGRCYECREVHLSYEMLCLFTTLVHSLSYSDTLLLDGANHEIEAFVRERIEQETPRPFAFTPGWRGPHQNPEVFGMKNPNRGFRPTINVHHDTLHLYCCHLPRHYPADSFVYAGNKIDKREDSLLGEDLVCRECNTLYLAERECRAWKAMVFAGAKGPALYLFLKEKLHESVPTEVTIEAIPDMGKEEDERLPYLKEHILPRT